MIDVNTACFALLGVLLMGYAILDGFDLGVGILHPLVRDERERRVVLNSIGPLWDGNEVWLVTFGGALFAAFPRVYATLLSAFYLPVMVILFALIGRAISLEFRSKMRSARWRRFWDLSFFASSFVATAVFGVALGNVVAGIPIGPEGEYVGTLGDLLRGFPLAVGALAVATAAMHGSIYLYLKTEGELQRRIHAWMWRSFFGFLAAWIAVSTAAVLTIPRASSAFSRWPVAWILVVLHVLAVANIPRAIHQGRAVYAFVSSCCTIAALTSLVALAIYPDLAISTLDPAWAIDVYTGASSAPTLRRILLIAAIGAPLVASYTVIVYWVFRGKVKLDEHSY